MGGPIAKVWALVTSLMEKMAIVSQNPWLICYHLLSNVADFGRIRLGPQSTESRHSGLYASFLHSGFFSRIAEKTIE